MPGYIIHLAIGKVYEKNNNIEDIESFEKGIIAPDLTDDKAKSHYGPGSSKPGLSRYIKENGISNDYEEGYFLHLLSDYLFYNKFLERWDSRIYGDYDILNDSIKEKYKITIPKEIEEVVKPRQGKLAILDEEKTYKFIETVGKINIRETLKEKEVDYERRLERI